MSRDLPAGHEPGQQAPVAVPIYRAEVESINERRNKLDLPAVDLTGLDSPSADAGLNGLAISGGGIRSSTFSLGIIQYLIGKGLFRRFDYMSTVSGGGYTGSMISSLLNDTHDSLPLSAPSGEQEPETLKHLRHGSNYLCPGGFLDAIRLPAVLLRGVMLNLLLILPYLMLAVILTELIHEPLVFHNPFISRWIIDYPEIAFLSIAFVLYALFAGVAGLDWRQRDLHEKAIALTILVIIVGIVSQPLIRGVELAIRIPWDELVEWQASYLKHTVLALAGGLMAAILFLIRASVDFSRLFSRVIIIIAGITGPAVIYFLYLLILVAQVDSPYIEIGARQLNGLYADCRNEPGAGCELDRSRAGDLITALNRKGVRDTEGALRFARCQRVQAQASSPLSALERLVNPWSMDFESEEYYQLYFNWTCQKPGKACLKANLCDYSDGEVEDRFIRLLPAGPESKVAGARLRWGGQKSGLVLLDDHSFLGLFALLMLLNYLFINVNKSSLHGFYRDRLSRMYLLRWKNRLLGSNDDLKLSELNGPDAVAPYHIINTALNLQGVTSGMEQYRKADFFMFSKHYCGSASTGYCRTEALEKLDPHVNLGTAMAISAAAAAPNMGSTTIKPLVFIMTLFNFRLGYWVPNPCAVNQRKRIPSPRMGYLLREATGRLTHRTPLVNVSDGGHLENLAIYELLRRRCRFIVAIDGEADPAHGFNGLITLVRLAKIDLGIDISIDLEALRLQDGRCRSQHALADIDYGEKDGKPRLGKLLYLKLSYLSAGNPFLDKYARDHPDFPHETTADQFFDEEQFEAYRALGYQLARTVAGQEDLEALFSS